MPSDYEKEMKEFEYIEKMEEALPQMDVISMSRIQQERFSSEVEYQKYHGSFVIDKAAMEKAKKDAILIQPLPRVGEVAPEVDDDPRAKYFEQIKNGVFLRMALLRSVLK